MERNKLQNTHIELFAELSALIEQSRHKVESYANSTMVGVFWHVGKRINEHILQNKRAEYGKEIVSTLSTQLTERFGSNFEEKNLRRMFPRSIASVEVSRMP